MSLELVLELYLRRAIPEILACGNLASSDSDILLKGE